MGLAPTVGSGLSRIRIFGQRCNSSASKEQKDRLIALAGKRHGYFPDQGRATAFTPTLTLPWHRRNPHEVVIGNAMASKLTPNRTAGCSRPAPWGITDWLAGLIACWRRSVRLRGRSPRQQPNIWPFRWSERTGIPIREAAMSRTNTS